MGRYEEWKTAVERKLQEGFDKEKIPPVIRRCPRCGNLSLEFAIAQGKIVCKRCDFTEAIKQVK